MLQAAEIILCILWLLTCTSHAAVDVMNATLSVKRHHLLFIFQETTRSDFLEMFNGISGTTPNLRRYFSKPGSALVDQMHADYPLCNPSRAAILLGRSPDTTGVKTNHVNWRSNRNAKSWRTLPRFLKDNGYVTMLGGKVFHTGTNDPSAWNVIFDRSDKADYSQCKRDRSAKVVKLGEGKDVPFKIGCSTTSLNLPDFELAKKASIQLTNFAGKRNNKPFAMFIGFAVPHFPLRVNQKYFISKAKVASRIPRVEPPRIRSQYRVTYSLNAPRPVSGDEDNPGAGEIPDFIKDGTAFTGPGSPQVYRENLFHLGLSGARQTDAAVGMVLKTLERLGLAENTLVLLTSDHGFGYGETRLWEKDLPLDIATRIPLLLNAPWIRQRASHTGHGFFMNGLDIYRTVAGLLNLNGKVDKGVEGRDLSAAIFNGRQAGTSVAYSQVVRCSNPFKCHGTLKNVDVVGYTARTKAYRYIVYFHAVNGQVKQFTRDNVIAEELYQHSNDRSTIYNPRGARWVGHEFFNIAARKPQVLRSMFGMVVARFKREGHKQADQPLPPRLPSTNLSSDS